MCPARLITYEVIVGNIGAVYSGPSRILANAKFTTYVERSKADAGRAAGESVTLMKDGEIAIQYVGDVDADAEE